MRQGNLVSPDLLSDDAEYNWNGINRRKEQRTYLSRGLLELDLSNQDNRLTVTNISMTGLGGILSNESVLREGQSLMLHHSQTNRVMQVRIERLAFDRVGLSTGDRDGMKSLLDFIKDLPVTRLHQRQEGEIVVEGFLGIGAHSEMRRSMRFKVIDLSRTTGMDLFGLGILFAHQENGCKISGCRGRIKNLLGLARFCDKCIPQNPTPDCPRYSYHQKIIQSPQVVTVRQASHG